MNRQHALRVEACVVSASGTESVVWFHQRATQQLVAGERGVAPFFN